MGFLHIGLLFILSTKPNSTPYKYFRTSLPHLRTPYPWREKTRFWRGKTRNCRGRAMGEEEMSVEQVEEEFTVWKKNTPFLYDLIISHPLEWPSLTVQFLPSPPLPYALDSFSVHKLVLGTHTSDGFPNYLMVADAFLPRNTAAPSEQNPTIPKVSNFLLGLWFSAR